MKLLLCTECQDVIRLFDEERKCKCGKVSGKYTNDIDAVYSGDTAVPVGFANNTLHSAVIHQPVIGSGRVFTAFVIPVTCPTFIKVEKLD